MSKFVSSLSPSCSLPRPTPLPLARWRLPPEPVGGDRRGGDGHPEPVGGARRGAVLELRHNMDCTSKFPGMISINTLRIGVSSRILVIAAMAAVSFSSRRRRQSSWVKVQGLLLSIPVPRQDDPIWSHVAAANHARNPKSRRLASSALSDALVSQNSLSQEERAGGGELQTKDRTGQDRLVGHRVLVLERVQF
jgi:hypothetical protein